MRIDSGEVIDPPGEMTIVQLDALQDSTAGRFSWTFARNSGGTYAFCVYVNHELVDGNREKDKNDAWKVMGPMTKMIKIVDTG